MKLQSLKSRENNQKSSFSRGKTTKNAAAFKQNKPNSKNIKIAINSYMTGKYEILTAGRGKKQTQFKPNSNPIPERPKMNVNYYITDSYKKNAADRAKKQTQFKKR